MSTENKHTPTPYIYASEEEYGIKGRFLEGTIPTIRLKDMDVLFVSLGAPREETTAKRDEVIELLKANSHASLVAENKRLRGVLTDCKNHLQDIQRTHCTGHDCIINAARAALNPPTP